MIDIIQKQDCCGCGACVQICPKGCMCMVEDTEGFLYPQVDKSVCVNCGLCEKVCPVIHQNKSRTPLKVYAAKNMDEEVRLKSSSGGIFTLLAESVIKRGGVVFGAKFDDEWMVVHDYTDNIEGVAAFRGSKYVQSIIGNAYRKVEQFLKSGRMVLFTGTPCQIAGLKKYLRKEYKKLLAVDLVCHGVPSPKVWQMYLEETNRSKVIDKKKRVISSNKEDSITHISFRDKTNGWKRYSLVILKESVSLHETLEENIFIKGFLKNLYLRPSCAHCPNRSLKSDSDITIADFWNIEKINMEYDDDKGVSLILVNSDFGRSYLETLSFSAIEQTFDLALFSNPSITDDSKFPENRACFFSQLNTTSSISQLIANHIKLPFYKTLSNLPFRIFFFICRKLRMKLSLF
ncbi:Coenzyme F420 hydrogenase/dehydrogenase, beta subunit C-terminal domain [Bacteroides fragilis]|uniref:F420H(2):quinone oxidoreductase n=1 Tax=Bacteroides fragilis TaxID=817 RepID=A0AAP9D0N8_BACFG|nr:Coenzyme F420 hydrogenase/dehydrogenase, beta subunit C-terminal domain [Bacteroides fragilis]MBV4152501.1 Coenzyme F420 hydrogenase/dehydrogenase, beta subunit C-terminal domain [Bacteroides fragilis]MCE8580947.1 Coenzyme F420 hydrogenase/dehydrogenase, beta subunit C-terminal domain [Bacteroides fragilis]MCE8649134.1 Coenzyme F420 hydrogenase/dehydrogenase, beta subunit C-terminal domain [Bacteroides fragilis]MCM0235270.1 Coenzyme F420 hydrogenase/dehydrogenase, beta subunit C-terminal dom